MSYNFFATQRAVNYQCFRVQMIVVIIVLIELVHNNQL